MKDILVGSTGFVGGNLTAKHTFAMGLHSTDIEEGFGACPELVVYAGVPAAMFLANQNPAADLALMVKARENLKKINAKKVVLISTIAVYQDSRGKTEDSPMETDGLSAYGANRLQLEQWVREDFPDALIVRLPALYGIGLKKNFLYDLHTITPAMLRPEKYQTLAEKSKLVAMAYSDGGNGFYKLNGRADEQALKDFFVGNDFNALAFTDSRSNYQFYPLGRLWQDIRTALKQNLTLLNLTTPPVSAGEVYTAFTGKEWINETPKPFDYDLRSNYAELLGGKDGYLCTKEEELAEICEFLKGWN